MFLIFIGLFIVSFVCLFVVILALEKTLTNALSLLEIYKTKRPDDANEIDEIMDYIRTDKMTK